MVEDKDRELFLLDLPLRQSAPPSPQNPYT